MHARRSTRVLLVFSLILASTPLLAASFTSNGSGVWNAPGTWSPAGVPGAGDTVTIQSGHAVTLDASRSVGSLTVNGTLALSTFTLTATNMPSLTGTISGTAPGSLDLTGTGTWSGGTLSGSAGLNVGPGAILTIGGGSTKVMQSSFQLVVDGTVNWTGGTILLNTGSLLDIASGATFDAQFDGTITNNSGSGSISNAGTFVKSSGGGTTTVNSGIPFANSGRLDAPGGSLDIRSLTLNAGSILGDGFTIISGTTTIAGASTVESGAAVTFSGGTLGGPANLTVNGSMTWTGGVMSGAGGSVTIPAGKTLTISGAATKVVQSSFQLVIGGTATWTGGTILLNTSSLLQTQVGGIFDAQFDGSITNNSGSGSITNAGTLKKSGGAGTTTITSGVPVSTTGRAEVTSGTINIQTHTLATGAILGGAFTIISGTTTIAGPSTVEAGSTLTLSGGTLGGSANLTVNGALNWTGGTMSGAGGSIAVAAGTTSTIGGSATKVLQSNFQLTVGGTLQWSDGTILMNTGSILSIAGGGIFDAQGNDAITNNSGNGSISSAGTILKSAGGAATSVTSGVPVTNSGRIEVQSGTFAAANLTLASGTVIGGSGFTIATGTTSVTGTSIVEAGATMFLTGGTLSGTFPLTVQGVLKWTGGTMNGGTASADIAAGGTLNVAGAGTKTLSGGFDLNIAGAANWTGGTILLNTSALLNVQPTGTFDAQFDGSITNNSGSGSISNSGTFLKSAGAGATTVASGVPFANSARIEIQSGKSNFQALTLGAGSVIAGTGFTIASGTTTIGGAATVENGAVITQSGGTLNGSGNLAVDGTMQWTGGTMSGTGSLTLNPTKAMNVIGASTKVLQSSFDLKIAGTAVWTDGTILVNTGSLLAIEPGGVLDAQGNNSITNNSGAGSVTNNGTFRKSNSTATTLISSGVPFSSPGTIDVQSGALQVTNPSLTSTSNLNFGIAGPAPLTSFGRLAITGAVTFNGTIDVDVIGPYSPLEGDQFAVITYTSRSGTLAESLDFGTGRSFSTTYGGTSLTLTASCDPPSPNVAASATSFCTGDSVTLTSTPSGGTPPYAYQWFQGATLLAETSASLVTSTGGSFSVVVTDSASCSAQSPAINVTEHAVTPVAVAGPAAVCPNAPFTLDAGPGFASYSWSTGQTTQTINVATTVAKTYTVTVTNGEGCPASDSHTVAIAGQPAANIIAPTSVAPGSSGNTASVAAQPGATYVWTISAGSILTGQGTHEITFAAPAAGALTLGVTVGIGGCFASDAATLDVIAADLSIDKSGPGTVEAGATIVYTITVTNFGPSDAPNATIVDSLPFPSSLVEIEPGPWTCTSTPTSVTCTGDAAAGSSSEITIMLTAPEQAGTIVNRVAIDSAIADSETSNNFDSVTTTVTAVAACPDAPPSLIEPADGAGDLASPVTFRWSGIAARRYEVWIVGNGSAPARLGSTQATSLTAPVPTGTFRWYVVARLREGCQALVSQQRTLTVRPSENCAANPAPGITAPAQGAVVERRATFSWLAAAGAIGYRIWIEVDGGAPEDIGSTRGELTLAVDLPSGAIVAYVEALFGGCPPTRSPSVAFTVPAADRCAERAAATPLSPVDQAVIDRSSVTFVWLGSERADGYRVWATIDGAAPVVLGATSETTLDAIIESGEVEWWIESLYAGCASTESRHVRLTIPPSTQCGSALPVPVSPAAGALVGDANVRFEWNGPEDAIAFDIWLSLAGGTPMLIGSTIGSTAGSTGGQVRSLTQQVSPGELEWFVTALVDRCPARASRISRFTLRPADACSGNRRAVPISPLDAAKGTSPIDFHWSHPSGATAFELHVLSGDDAAVVVETNENRAPGIALDPGPVRWFVRSFFADGCTYLDSPEERLRIVPKPAACSPLQPPAIVAPGQVSSGAAVRIQWNESAGATGYGLQVAGNPNFLGAESILTSATQQTITRQNDSAALLAIYARVRAFDTDCAEPRSSAFGPTTAIFILPRDGADGSAPLDDPDLLTFTIPLGTELAGQTFTAATKEPWLTVTPASGVVEADGTELTVTADATQLHVGTSLGAVTITLDTPESGNVSTHGTTISIPTMSISLVTPVTSDPKSTPPPDALIIPAVAHADGINSRFQSDVRVSNTSPLLLEYQLTFVPSGAQGIASGKQTTFSIEPGRTIALDDILRSWFGTGGASTTGTLEIRPLTQTNTSTSSAALSGLANLVTFASSRTFNVTSNGTFGQYIPAIPFANFVGSALASGGKPVLSLQQIAQSSRYRTNLGLVEGSGQAATLLVKVFGDSGQKLAEFPVSLNGGQHTQLNAFLSQQGITSLSDGRVEIEVTSGNGKITAYASVLDNETSDPLLVTPVTLSDEGNTKWVVPGVADLNNGFANWQTDLRVFNADSEPVDATFLFYSQNGGAPKTATITLAPGEVRQFDQTLASLFGVTNDGGAVHITTTAAARLIATARTYNQTTGGTYGQFISAVTPLQAAGVGSRPLQILQVEESSRYRSNIGLAEVSGQPVTLEISVVPPDAKFTAVTELTLQANEFRQIGSLLESVGLAETFNARVTIRAIDGAGRVTAYASVIDSVTNDPTYVPAQ